MLRNTHTWSPGSLILALSASSNLAPRPPLPRPLAMLRQSSRRRQLALYNKSFDYARPVTIVLIWFRTCSNYAARSGLISRKCQTQWMHHIWPSFTSLRLSRNKNHFKPWKWLEISTNWRTGMPDPIFVHCQHNLVLLPNGAPYCQPNILVLLSS